MVIMSGDLAQSQNYDSTNAAPEWQAMSLRWRDILLMEACPLEGLVGRSFKRASEISGENIFAIKIIQSLRRTNHFQAFSQAFA